MLIDIVLLKSANLGSRLLGLTVFFIFLYGTAAICYFVKKMWSKRHHKDCGDKLRPNVTDANGEVSSEKDEGKKQSGKECPQNFNHSLNKETDEIENGKLSSEFGKERTSKSHWIKQDGADLYIDIDDALFNKMIELQRGNPSKWENKELDLFLYAKALYGNAKIDKSGKKKNKVFAWVILTTFVLYEVLAMVFNTSVVTFNEPLMEEYYCIYGAACSYSRFKDKMCSSIFFRKRVYTEYRRCIFGDNYQASYGFTYDSFLDGLQMKNNLENPIVWYWW